MTDGFLDDPRLQILGLPCVQIGDEKRPIMGPLVERSLLALCAAWPGSITFEDLADVVWESNRPVTWQSSLRMHISRLRKSFGAEVGAPRLMHERNAYRLVVGEPEHLDFVRFQSLCSLASAAATADERLRCLDAALAMWSRDLEVEFDHPLASAFVGRLRSARVAVERQRFGTLVDLGRYGEVIDGLRESVSADPLNEGLVEPYVAALTMGGFSEEALEVVGVTMRALRELGLEPGIGVQSLQRRLVAAEIPAQPKTRSVTSNVKATIIVGREEEQSTIDRFGRSGLGLLYIEGEAGLGKSHLVTDFLRSVERPVLFASCMEHGPPGQLFRDLVESVAPRLLARELEAIEALWLCIDGLSSNGSAILVIEDLHYVDLASAKLLKRLLSQRKTRTVQIIVTGRPAPWPLFVQELMLEVTLQTDHHVILRPLERNHVDSWLALQSGLRGSKRWDMAARLRSLSGGNPLIIELLLREVAAAAIRGTDLDIASVGNLMLPSNAASVMFDSEILAVAAVGGMQFEVSVIAEVTGCTAAEVIDALDAAWRVGVLDRRVGTTSHFRHELIRHAVLATRSETWKGEQHKLMAEVMNRRGLDESLVTLHLAHALLHETDAERIAELFERVEVLQQNSRWEVSTASLELLLENLNAQPWLYSPADIARLYHLLGNSYEGSHDSETARTCFREAARRSMEAGDVATLAKVAMDSAGGSQPFDGDPERVGWLAAALGSDALDQAMHLSVLAELVHLSALVSVTDEVLIMADELTKRAEGRGNEAMAISLHGVLISLLAFPSSERCIQLIRMVDVSQPGIPYSVRVTLTSVELVSLVVVGDAQTAYLRLGQLDQFAQEKQRPGDVWLSLIVRSILEAWFGRLDRSHDLARQAFELAERHGVHDSVAVWNGYVLTRYLADDDLASMLTNVIVELNPDSTPGVFDLVFSLYLRERAHPGSVTSEELGIAIDELKAGAPFLGWASLLALLVEVHVSVDGGYSDELLNLLRPYRGTFLTIGVAPAAFFGPVDYFLSRLEFQAERFDAAVDLAASAAALCESAACRLWLPKLTEYLEKLKNKGGDGSSTILRINA